MVNWFKHDIPAWMDGTESLSDGAYRAYHVICQQIYLHEGSIALNEHGIAGRCRQSVKSFRKNLNELLEAKKLTLENGRLSNSRADLELEKIRENRINAGKGGEKSGESRKSKANPLQNNNSHEAALPDTQSLKDKTREDETRAQQDARAVELCKGIVKAFKAADWTLPDTAHCEVWLRQGYDPDLCLAVVKARLAKNRTNISSLKFFDSAIKEAHDNKAPSPAATNWNAAMNAFTATGNWPRWAPGSEPGMAGCVVPTEILRNHGIDPTTGKPVAAKEAA